MCAFLGFDFGGISCLSWKYYRVDLRLIKYKKGNLSTCFSFRWFALFYMAMMFFIIPLYIFGLSMAGPVALYIGVLPLVTIFLLAIVINVLQRKYPHQLPEILRNWNFLPLWMRSLDPIDRWMAIQMKRNTFLAICYLVTITSFPYFLTTHEK